MAIVKEALSRSILPIAISSSNRHHKCWMPHDKVIVTAALKHLYENVLKITELNSLPLYLFGASSGGSFVGQFGQAVKSMGIHVKSVCVQISSLYSSRVTHETPPTLFVHMAQDTSTATDVTSMIKRLQAEGTPSAEMICHPKPITPTYFAEHGDALSSEDSATLVRALIAAGFLSADSFLLSDPRKSDWREVRTSAVTCRYMRNVKGLHPVGFHPVVYTIH